MTVASLTVLVDVTVGLLDLAEGASAGASVLISDGMPVGISWRARSVGG